ncbi:MULTISPECIES: hypothetical protein [unclassified Pseudomonas]|uniref:hypothetical protein n=1 Tax=unclassified Pseudomonas TaxID=196821 RepID=UPI002447E3D1|nr:MULTISPECIES: hypothetical protein [unclassified Pseudomonas]MDG9931261.1 hypothetical protein [Pseudomonas sp. GD04042]MDH0484878.1 hypothetical protein [Pseudomonas sp. GD04015]MDH0606962.1 hypothetical protein [Pseudomonas sp. GD03869]
MKDISEFESLWKENPSAWALLHVNASNLNEPPRYLIVNTETRHGKIIEDDEVFDFVIQKMLMAGVRVVKIGDGF